MFIPEMQNTICKRAYWYLSAGFELVTLMIKADCRGVETDIVLIFITLVLCHTEYNSILHLHPEFPMFILQHTFICLLPKHKIKSRLSLNTICILHY